MEESRFIWVIGPLNNLSFYFGHTINKTYV